MGELAQLLLAIAGLISSIGGATAAILSARKGGKKARQSVKDAQAEADTQDENTPPEDAVNLDDIKAVVDFINQMQSGSNPPS